MRRNAARWRTSFGRWVATVGVGNVTAGLARAGQPVTTHTVYDWLSGHRSPRPGRAIELVRLSRGSLRLEDIYRHVERVREPAGSGAPGRDPA